MIKFTANPNSTPGQAALLHSTAWAVLVAGGFGSGKTTGLIQKLLQLKAYNGAVPGLLVAQSYSQLWAVAYRHLCRTLRSSNITGSLYERMVRVHDKQGECYLDWGDGAPIFLRSAKNPGSIDSLNVGWACGDEPRHWPADSFNYFLARVRVPCRLSQRAFSSTPSIGFLSDEFNSGKTDRDLIRAPTWENAVNLAPNYIENLRLSYSPRLAKALIEGHFVNLEGAVYDQLDPDIWRSDWVIDWKYDPACTTYLAVDPGFRRSAWVFVQEMRKGQYVVFDQIMADDMSDYACVEAVNAKGYQIDEVWCDPAADATQSALSLDTLTMLRGIRCRTPEPIRHITGVFRSIQFGVDKVRTMLGKPDSGLPIRLFFARSLQETERNKKRGIVRDLLGYRYPDVKDGRPTSDLPIKDGLTDHSNDALRYLVVGLWLTTPLRNIDPRMSAMLRNAKTAGYRVAA